MDTVEFTVPNISCGHCVATIERAVAAVPGVQKVTGDVATKHVKVLYDAPANRAAIVAAMTEWEYPPQEA
jgi:copper chaperone